MPPKMTILFIDNTCTFGGAINSLEKLVHALDKQRFVPILVTGQAPHLLAEMFDIRWYHMMPQRSWVDNHRYLKLAGLSIFRFNITRRLLNALRLLYWIACVHLPEGLRYYRIGRKHQVSIVHLNNIIGSQLSGIIAAKLLRVPLIAHMRDFEAISPVTRLYARAVDHFVAISQAVRHNIGQLGVADEKITLVHDAIDITALKDQPDPPQTLHEAFGTPPNCPTFAIFGRVIAWKGIREFIEASRKVMERIPNARGFVVGSPSDGDAPFFLKMQQFAGELGLAERIVFTGYRKDALQLMRQMDIIVHASKRPEPFGMVIIEGMALGKPVVATRGGGPLDIVRHMETGILIEMGDSDALAGAITFLLRHPEVINRMGKAAYHHVKERFSIERNVLQLEALYQNQSATSGAEHI
jgi:predicted outer membrane repeat protein